MKVEKLQQEIYPAQLVIVSKGQPIEAMKMLEPAIFGENRIGEAVRKRELLGKESKLHFIGHLQTNKAKDCVRIADMIQSLDSIRLARKISREARKIGKTQEVLVQVKMGGRYGIPYDEVLDFLENSFENVNIMGLMCIAPHIDPEKTRPYFKKMKKLFDKTGLDILSMGMSSDYKVAIEEGSNMVRIGRAIFGNNYK